MARKKMEPIEGIGRSPETKLIVQKSRPLVELSRSELTLAEFKILDMYLARIDSHKPERRVVKLEKGEIEKALGVKKISAKDLADRLIRLGQGVKVPDSTKKSGFRVIWLLEEVACEQDEDGLWRVTLEASSKGLKYFFNLDNLGYFRYKLRCVSGLTSRYSYILFLYLEENRFRESWEVRLEELKEILNCDKEESYKEFKKFNQKILKRCHNELTEKTECRFSYDPIKKGRSVVAIRFTLETLKDLIESDISGQITIDEWFAENVPSGMPLWATACRPAGQTYGCDFTPEEILQIDAVLCTIDDDRLPHPDTSDSIDIRRYHYMAEKYAAMMRYDSQKPIRHKANYMLQMLRNDADVCEEK